MPGTKRKSIEGNMEPSKKDKKDTKVSKGHWTQGLRRTLENKENVIKKTELVTVIKDKFPKAKHHYLIVHPDISSISFLSKEHIDLIKHMVDVGNEIIKDLQRDDEYVFKMGFHAIPSMDLLHMHLVSNDFDSPCLKNKKHWNSFTSSFFISAERLIKKLETEGRIEIDKGVYEEVLKKDLVCHKCREQPKNMPTLKDHIKSHL